MKFHMDGRDIFVLPSLNEGNPTVMFECLGCGKAVCGYKGWWYPEIICSDEIGLLCQPGDHEDLTRNILITLNKNWDGEK